MEIKNIDYDLTIVITAKLLYNYKVSKSVENLIMTVARLKGYHLSCAKNQIKILISNK